MTLPLARYEELRAKANAGPVVELPPPAPFTLESADFEIQVGPASAHVVAGLTLSLYAGGWQTLPVGASGSFVAARLAGLDGRVVTAEGGSSLVVRGAGRHKVELESVLPVTRDETATRPTWKIALLPPAAAVVRAHLVAPKEIEEVTIEGTGLARRQADGSWEIVGGPGAPLGIVLRGKAVLPERATLPLRFEATTVTSAVLSRTRLEVHGWIEARVAQGRLEKLTVPLPEGLKAASVSGPLAGWNVEDGKLVITPLSPVENALAVEIELTGSPRDTFVSPVLVPEGSARTLLFTRAALAGDGLLEVAEPGATRVADAGETARLPAGLRQAQGRLFALADGKRPPHWTVAWAEKTEVLASQVDRLRVDVMVGEAGRASYQLWATVRNRGAQQLTFTFPAGFELAAGSRDGVEVVTGLAGNAGAAGTGGAGGAQTLAVPLAAGEGTQVVELRGVLPLALPQRDGDLLIPLPALSAPAARVEVRALLPGGRTYVLADATRSGGVGAPPVTTGAASAVSAANAANAANASNNNALGQQMAVNARVLAGVPPLGRPAGFTELEASWSALSAAPAPLVIKVQSARERESWF